MGAPTHQPARSMDHLHTRDEGEPPGLAPRAILNRDSSSQWLEVLDAVEVGAGGCALSHAARSGLPVGSVWAPCAVPCGLE